MGKAKDLAEKPAYLSSAAAKYALGVHRGPFAPKESLDGNDLQHVETADTITLENIKRTPTQNLRRHWFRFWCCYVFWSIIFLAIFLPIFFLICIPAISQNVLNRSTLLLVESSILEPRPDSISLSMTSALDLPVSLPVRIDPMALELFNREQPMNNTWGMVYLGPYLVKGNTTLGVTNQHTPIDPEQWYNYVWKFVHLHHPPLSVRGKTTSYLGQLVSKVTMNKDIPQTTLNNFTGFSIDDSTLIEAREDGTNLLANATLPNPSVVTLEIGNTTMNLFSGDILLGNATLPNLFLRPGNHATPVEGILDLSILIQNLSEIVKDQAEYLKKGNLRLKTIGTNVEWNGVQVPYYTKVMKGLTLEADVPIAGLLGNTVHSLFHGKDNPLANLSLTMPETDDSDGSILDGTALDNLRKLKRAMGDLNLDKYRTRKRGMEMTVADLMARL
ncbi:DUF3712 domain-containing protein [Aspergillus ruber CBS 135680]|uniref:Uncharacterized protein n=1 Tax=Aspergillus ruber (strain CBS 135680) TaxID=1388766 RepID=A0A017S3X1_ASPRC|nr:uncharacterized protein EURHEDRAFT_486796 [Aspergillus ruber CBS 135680]EYE91632.1 hypothetical protein EURHEDRAFT_486796 [Aspergillus ruber CBS 135680]